ncbi:MAG TPA: hypothetical protein VFB73_08565 [Chloroflexota bacterium]|nr:hypothetical protein [Chloroflexota bacterium]
MQLDAMTSKAEVLDALRRAAEATWGPERVGALQAMLEAAAAAVWELAQLPLELTDVEPDFIGGAEG